MLGTLQSIVDTNGTLNMTTISTTNFTTKNLISAEPVFEIQNGTLVNNFKYVASSKDAKVIRIGDGSGLRLNFVGKTPTDPSILQIYDNVVQGVVVGGNLIINGAIIANSTIKYDGNDTNGNVERIRHQTHGTIFTSTGYGGTPLCDNTIPLTNYNHGFTWSSTNNGSTFQNNMTLDSGGTLITRGSLTTGINGKSGYVNTQTVNLCTAITPSPWNIQLTTDNQRNLIVCDGNGPPNYAGIICNDIKSSSTTLYNGNDTNTVIQRLVHQTHGTIFVSTGYGGLPKCDTTTPSNNYNHGFTWSTTNNGSTYNNTMTLDSSGNLTGTGYIRTGGDGRSMFVATQTVSLQKSTTGPALNTQLTGDDAAGLKVCDGNGNIWGAVTAGSLILGSTKLTEGMIKKLISLYGAI